MKGRRRENRFSELDILRDLMLGGRHSRTTVARCGVSLPTADRWLKVLYSKIPDVKRVRHGKVTWFEWRRPEHDPEQVARVVREMREARRTRTGGPSGRQK